MISFVKVNVMGMVLGGDNPHTAGDLYIRFESDSFEHVYVVDPVKRWAHYLVQELGHMHHYHVRTRWWRAQPWTPAFPAGYDLMICRKCLVSEPTEVLIYQAAMQELRALEEP